jgi:hypothetical protein
MKDITSSSKHSRNTVYPRKRPSPHGVSKNHYKTPLLPQNQNRKTPRSAKAALIQQQRLREAQLLALRREGVIIEEEYREEIRRYMHDMENFTMSSPSCMDQQPEIRWNMRPHLVDFLVELHFTFRLRPETLYLALNILDRYVSRRIVYVKHYQLVGCAALWIAAKFEDAKERVPSASDLRHLCQDTYDESAFVQMESHILSTIKWTLGHPTAEAWLRLMCCGPCSEPPDVQNVARFLMEITLFYREFIEYPPSSIALASLTLARHLLKKGRRPWEETTECLEIIEHLDNRLQNRVNELSETLVKKYSFAFYSKAATTVVQYYLTGGHYVHQPPALPITPRRSSFSSKMSTPMSTSTTVSDLSDDMPLTPTSPHSSESLPAISSNDKENNPPHFVPIINKHRIDTSPKQFLPHDFVTYSRPALQNHNVNVSSPRPAMVL